MNESYKFRGVIELIQDTVEVSETFKKRDIIVNDGHLEYPQSVSFQFVKDKCDILDKYAEGQEVEISFNLRGRKWTSPQGEDKYFNTLDAWRIESVDGEQSAPVQEAAVETGNGENDDLPF